MLTDAQVAFFQTFGFLVLQQAFSRAEMAVIDAEFEDVMAADRAGRSGSTSAIGCWAVPSCGRQCGP